LVNLQGSVSSFEKQQWNILTVISGAAVDKYNYAYPNDPLVKGFIVQSGTSSMANQIDPTGSNFTYVASQVGCTSSDKDEEFLCMQSADAGTIIAVYNKYNATLNGNLGLSFQPAPDNMTDFSNYADRRSRGLFSKVPTVYSSVDNEGASLVAYKPAGPNQTAVDALTRSIATCPGAAAALYVLITYLDGFLVLYQPKSIVVYSLTPLPDLEKPSMYQSGAHATSANGQT
jgi:hypothetical protein